MPSCKSVYDPREDSALLEKYVRQYAKGSVLDMGTGSGIQAITAALSKKVDSVLALDVQKEVVSYCMENIKNRKIKFFESDLFEIFKSRSFRNKKFDTIIFNPPYLPSELKLKDLTFEGGKKGYEVLERFLNDVNNYLKPDGIILIIFSSLTKKERIDDFIANNMLEHELLEKQHFFFEELYAYLIKKSELLKELEKKGVKNIRYFAKGKRGIIFTGNLNKRIAIKTKNPKSQAVARVENEINFLRLLNKKDIGPKLLFYGKDYLACEFVYGIQFLDFLSRKKQDKKIILKIIKEIFSQLYALDKLRVNKEEMSRPVKHIIINDENNPVLLDFERCRYVLNPSNVTQFCDFLISNMVLSSLKSNKISMNKKKIVKAAKLYKKNQNEKNLGKIIENIK